MSASPVEPREPSSLDGGGTASSSSSFTGRGARQLFYRTWVPAPAKALVVLAHGLGEHSGRYEHVGQHLARAGYAVWALDHCGHGRSDGTRVFVDRFDTFVEDLETFRALAVPAQPGLPTFLLGHSMGGAIATAHAIDHPGCFAGMVLTGPALQPSLRVSALVVAVGKLVAKVCPKLGVVGLDGGKVSRDPAVVVAYRVDPLVHHGKVTAGLGVQLLARAARFPAEVAGLSLPVLIIHGQADELVPIESSRNLVPRFGSPDLTFIEEPGLYHEVLNEPEQERVLATIVSWMDERLAAR